MPIEQYLEYFDDIIAANEWDNLRATAIFKVMIRTRSEYRTLIDSIETEPNRSSYVVIKKKIKESTKPLRDSKVAEFYLMQRKKDQSLDELAASITRTVEEIYPKCINILCLYVQAMFKFVCPDFSQKKK